MRTSIWLRGWSRRATLPFLVGLGLLVFATTAQGDGVGLVTTAKSLPPATIAVIDPESGSSSGTGTTDVRISVGDIILFRFDFFPVPNGQIHGLNGWLTEYIPPNTQVVGIRLLDDQGNTVQPNYPGIATNGCGRPCNGFNSVACMGGTCNFDDGSISQLYADTGVFYSTDARTERNPNMQFIQLDNGIMMIPPTRVGDIDGILGTSAPYFAHNDWDYDQVIAYGISNPAGNVSRNNGTGNTPFRYGSPVAGPLTHFDYEATDVGGSVIELNDVVGPWQRIQYPGALIGTGSAVTGSGPLLRTIADASVMGHNLTPLNPIPATANALRFAIGEVRVGEPVQVEVALRVLGTPIDNVQMQDVNCGETFGGDTSARSATGRADDNMWSLYLGSPACVFLNLQFDLDSDRPLAVVGETIEFTSTTRNLSTNTQTNVWVRQKYESSRIALAAVTPFPDGPPTCMVSNCDGDGLDCLLWNLGTMVPSAQVDIRTRYTVGGGGQVSHVMRNDYTSSTLGTIVGDPCAGGGVTTPGFRAQEINMIRAIGVITADLDTTTAAAASPGTASMSGSMGVTGTSNVGFDETLVVLPTGFTVADSNGDSNPDVIWGGMRVECMALCGTNTPQFNLATNVPAGTSHTLTFDVNVPSGTAAGLYDVDLQVWASQTGYGGRYETYFADIATIAVVQQRSERPVLACPILSSWTSIPGTIDEAAGTNIRLYFNLIERASGASVGAGPGTFDVGGFVATFGALYGGLEVRATAQAAGELESELSDSCFVTFVSQCQDGLDNDGDGLIDFPADPGCSSPTDGDEGDPQCSDGLDNDGDGDFDWPADLECDGPDDDDEGGAPACSDGVDNDGDGLVDFPADPDCTSATDRTEITLRRCMNRIDDDGDGLVDFPADPGCHSANDDDEADFAYLPDDVRARLLFVFDTSGSMNWHTCADEFTDGDGSIACGGSDVTCATCPTTPGCGNGIADDSRIFQARAGVTNVVAGFGEVEYGLMRFHQRARSFSCPTSNASNGSGGWQGAGPSPCGGGFSGADLLVGFSPENEYDLLEWMDNDDNYPGAGDPPPALDFELRGTGTTPIAGSLGTAQTYLTSVRGGDPAATCRPYRVILITDGEETCGGDPVAAAASLLAAGAGGPAGNYSTNVIGFATPDPMVRANLDAIAAAGGTTSAIFADDATTLSAAISTIVNDSILREQCNGLDDDCDTLIDEDFTLYCNWNGTGPMPTSYATGITLCTDPGETLCDGLDNNCDGAVDEGLLNACGLCGALPVEVCNGLDDDCDGPIDEGGVCSGCVPTPEICDGIDNNCNMMIDEGLSRTCGTPVGECTVGTEICAAGSWGTCSGVTPTTETCDGLDNDCDGVTDGITRPCGSGVGACVPGTEVCAAGAWSGACVGGTGPSMEICDNVDNNCDGSTDEGNPGGGAACGSSTGACTPGAITCVGGLLTCVGGTSGGPEMCNGTDDDCDGVIDEGTSPSTSCGTCGAGLLRCISGAIVCDGDRSPSMELCNGIDDNCDGTVDEGNPEGGGACGSAIGECTPGAFVCTGGVLVCSGDTGPATETCNSLDDDCDGVVDEGNPDGGASCGATDVGECEFGRQTCVSGALTCIGETVPSAEVCDGLDNDCDGMTDEGDPGGGATCGDDTGECMSGTLGCLTGALTCVGAVGPVPETCDGLDNDCDGVIDDGLDVGSPCGTDVGECVPGLLVCRMGAVVCDGAIGPEPETCNALDDDCDAMVDEALPLGGTCGVTTGACMPGMIQCVDGFEVCIGEVPSGPEVCDCEDNDCDMMTDEGSLCGATGRCIDCSCALPCSMSEFGRCPADRIPQEDPSTGECFCVSPRCNPDTCVTQTIEVDGETACAPDMADVPTCVCSMNTCTFACDGVVCTAPTVCHPQNGTCVEDNCRGLGCPTGQLCDPVTFECADDPCATAGCAADEVCRAGTCETSCATVMCPSGEICRGGACVTDACDGAMCASGEVCDPTDGMCVTDMCDGVMCPGGGVCEPHTGMCVAEPCAVVVCPMGQVCADGECELEVVPMPDAGPPDEDSGTTTTDAGMDAGFEDPEERVIALGGCSCDAADTGRTPRGLMFLLLALGLVLWRRRSSRGGRQG